jgi:hypothetical protein
MDTDKIYDAARLLRTVYNARFLLETLHRHGDDAPGYDIGAAKLTALRQLGVVTDTGLNYTLIARIARAVKHLR